MKKLWKRITSFLRGLRDFYSYEYDGYLFQSDKAYLLLGALLVCLISIVATSWIMYFSYQKNDEEYEKGLYDFLNTAAAYTANLTDDEYQMVAEELRHQLAFTNFNADNDIEMYMKYIANTAESCPLDQEHYPYKYYLVMTNNGEMEPIDCWAEEISDDEVVSFGALWDEVNETSVRFLYYPNKRETEIAISAGRGTVSAHKMKQTFCDECIRKLFDVFEETVLEELVIFDSKSGELYPIREMDMEIDGHIIEICLDEQWNYTIRVNG